MSEPLPRVRTPGDLRYLSDDELERFVDATGHTVTAGDVLQEVYRRRAESREQVIVRLTWAIFGFTVIVAIATVLLLVGG